MNYDELLEIADNATGGSWKASESCGEWSVSQSESPWDTIAVCKEVYPECAIHITEQDAKYFEAFQPSVVRDLLRDAARYQFIRADVQRMAAEGVYLGPQTAEQMDAAVDERMAKEKTNGL